MNAAKWAVGILSGLMLVAGAVMFFAFGLWQGFFPILIGCAGGCALGFLIKKS